MSDFVTDPPMLAGATVVILCMVIAASFYLLARLRDYNAQDRESSLDVLSNLREMHLKGDISDEEFRTIQTSTDRHLSENSPPNDSASQA